MAAVSAMVTPITGDNPRRNQYDLRRPLDGSLGHFEATRSAKKWKSDKSEKLTCFCPKSQPQIQHSTTAMDQMTISGPLFIILLIHWELTPLNGDLRFAGLQT
jgi:hypothetical protein